MWIKNFFILGFMLLIAMSCNVASIIADAETNLGDNFAKDLKPGLISFWKLDEQGSADTRFDSVGIHDLTSTGTAIAVDGISGAAVDCQNSSSGTGLITTTTPNISLSNSSNYTIAFWAQDNDGAGGGYAVDFGQTVIRVNTGGGFFEVSTDADASHSSLSNYPGGRWVHFTFVFNGIGDYVDYYVDGNYSESVAVGDSSLSPGSLTLCTPNYGGLNFPGFLDSVGLWDRALDTDEIRALASGNNNVD